MALSLKTGSATILLMAFSSICRAQDPTPERLYKFQQAWEQELNLARQYKIPAVAKWASGVGLSLEIVLDDQSFQNMLDQIRTAGSSAPTPTGLCAQGGSTPQEEAMRRVTCPPAKPRRSIDLSATPRLNDRVDNVWAVLSDLNEKYDLSKLKRVQIGFNSEPGLEDLSGTLKVKFDFLDIWADANPTIEEMNSFVTQHFAAKRVPKIAPKRPNVKNK